ncbi:hypothetical protein D3C81_1650110 [compost metagenome]
MVTQQVVDKASVRCVIVPGDATGFFRPLFSVFFLQRDQTEYRAVGQLRMSLCFQHGVNHPAGERADAASHLDQSFRCPGPVPPVLSRHMQRIGSVLILMRTARMLCHALPLVPDLNHRLTCFQRQALTDQFVRNRVPVAGTFNVVVRADLHRFVLRVFIRRQRQR